MKSKMEYHEIIKKKNVENRTAVGSSEARTETDNTIVFSLKFYY